MPRPLSPLRLLLRTLEESAAPFYALDGQRRIVFASRSLGEWVGIEPDKLVGLRCDYHAGGGGPLTDAAAALCPPPETFLGTLAAAEIGRPAHGEQPAERRPARFLRLPASAGGDDSLLLVAVELSPQPDSTTASAASPARWHAILIELRAQQGRRFHIGQLIGQSAAMCRVREQVRIAADVGARTLVVGPRGSGREHVARTIHYGTGAAPAGALVPIDCSLADAEQMQHLLASVLRRQAEAPAARPTALILDADRLRESAQHELMGFLQLPGVELHTLATSRVPLTRLAQRGKYREDLALTLSTLSIQLPPLARRPEDIPLLAQHLVEEFNADGGRQFSGLAPAAVEQLLAWHWPGNLDELSAAIRAACQQAAGPLLSATDFPDWVQQTAGAARSPLEPEIIRLDEFLEGIEREVLQRALAQARGNKSRAAALVGVNRARLLRRLVQLGLIAAPAAEEPVIFEPLPEES